MRGKASRVDYFLQQFQRKPAIISLHRCYSLQYIQMYENQLAGEIPLGIWGSPNIKQMLLWNNKFEGYIPGDIGKARNLMWLEIRNNRFSGSIPPQIGQLTN
eukprot:Gb_26228 [translate_table: standard]